MPGRRLSRITAGRSWRTRVSSSESIETGSFATVYAFLGTDPMKLIFPETGVSSSFIAESSLFLVSSTDMFYKLMNISRSLVKFFNTGFIIL